VHLEFLIRLKKNTSRDKKTAAFSFIYYIIIAFHCENGGKMYLDKNVFMIAENKMNNDVGIIIILCYNIYYVRTFFKDQIN